MNIEQIRKDTRHCHDKLFFNSAGSSLMPHVVVESMHAYLQEEERIGGYKLFDLQQNRINEFYQEAAQLLNCQAHNIAFANSATDAYAKALSSIPFQKGDVIICTDDDYNSNYIQFISLQKRAGIQLVRTKNLENGDLDLEDFQKLMEQHQPKLVSVSHIPTSSGLIQDVIAVGEICQHYNTLFLVDACQSVGHIPVDVTQIHCDFLTATGRKFLRGPRGTGLLYVSDRVLQEGYSPLFLDMRGANWKAINDYEVVAHAKRFEMWEQPYALVIGLKETIRYANRIGMEAIHQYNQQLMQQFRSQLAQVSKVRIFDQGTQTGNILTFAKAGRSLEEHHQHLNRHNVFFSTSQRTGSLIDYGKKNIDWAIRLSPHYFNTIDEVEQVVEIIEAL
ncbi:MAG: aminotransferase class V-fold PLP-dependent enzyme [Flammeovirgaceae bacterium]